MDLLTSTYLVPVWQLLLLGLVLLGLCTALGLVLRRLCSGKSSGAAFERRLHDSEKRNEDLRRSEEKFRHLYESAPVGILRILVDGSRVLMGNDAAARMFGFDTEAEFMESCTPKDFYADPDQHLELVDALNREGRVEGYEIMIKRPDGKRKIVSLWAHIHPEDGSMEGAVVDVTATRLAERELRDGHLFLQAVMDTLPTPLFFKDRSGRIRHVNKAFEEFMGMGRKAMLGKPVSEMIPDEALEQWDMADQGLLSASGAAMQRFESWVRTRGSGRRDVMVHEGLVTDSKDKRIGIVGVLTDVTERKRIEHNLREAEETYRNIFENSGQGIFTSTPDGRFLKVNAAMARLSGYETPELMVAEVKDIAKQIYANSNQRDLLLAALQRDGEIQGQELEVQKRDGKRVWVSVSIKGINDAAGELVRLEGVVEDITERKTAEHELTRRATTDALTGLPNRFLFEQAFEKMLAQAKRSGERLALLYMDLDNFKPVNDNYGHQVGDELLVEVARRIQARLRESDVAARLGGDEFGVLLWNPTDSDVVARIAAEIVESIGRSTELSVATVTVGVSIGGSQYPDHGEDARTLTKRADDAMYSVKQGGRNGFRMAE
ncbi:bifunctional diguanylate cyclase/phosphodiesterase [Desulfovibrio ferrophilus]|uniref:Diguanylate cyclase with PAS/PAC sensor n=1 Tax=Desulfovibrio ferrophilus TaxID=241368 RepID=A0A2Z6B048_9BACT|nr:sensor domain-containing diguanylate cyclase [Desulfovibrio ferrophilus]BBD08874.1 diguanylate cyclase with PAS/PAC sensor [Desulfovibrio ferrophilus]